MDTEVNLEIVMARRFDLVEQMAIIQGKHKAELAPLAEEVNLCETFIKDEMNRSGMQQCKTSSGMAFFTTKDSVTVENFDETLAEIREKGLWQLLNKAVNKTAVKEYIEVNKAVPPGVKYDSYKDLSWRRGKV
ncbi:MAG: hypothetical protein ACYDBH_00385 [Acidobacteriaceae bacterium]